MRDLHRSQIDIALFLVVTFLVIFFDRVTKSFFMGLLVLRESLPVFKNVLHFTLVHNTGIAFGFFPNQGIVFILIPVIALTLLIFNVLYYRQNNEILTKSYIIGFALILGGAIGNLYDRMIYGFVIDFIDFRVWPVFNIADSAIFVGAVIIAIKCFFVSSETIE